MTTTTRKGALKGAVAAAAGIAVLLGGLGRFALWSLDGADTAAATQTGHLIVTWDGGGDDSDEWVWTDRSDFVLDRTGVDNPWEDNFDANSSNFPVIDPLADFRMVPGDRIVGELPFTLSAEGDNLLVQAALVAAGDPVDAGDFVGLDDDVSARVWIFEAGTGDVVFDSADPEPWLVLGDLVNGDATAYTARIMIEFDRDAQIVATEGGFVDMDAPIDLGTIGIRIEQVRPPVS